MLFIPIFFRSRTIDFCFFSVLIFIIDWLISMRTLFSKLLRPRINPVSFSKDSWRQFRVISRYICIFGNNVHVNLAIWKFNPLKDWMIRTPSFICFRYKYHPSPSPVWHLSILLGNALRRNSKHLENPPITPVQIDRFIASHFYSSEENYERRGIILDYLDCQVS